MTRAADGPAPAGFDGRWEGELGTSALRLSIDITKTTDGLYFGTLTSIDQGGSRLLIDQITGTGDSLRLEISSAGATYVGVLSSDRMRLVGTWTQGGRSRLELTRTSAPPPAEPSANVYSLFGVAAEVTVPIRPMAFAGAGRQHLVYELHVANHSGVEMLLTRLAIVDDDDAILGRWEGAELHAIVAQRRSNVTDNRVIPAGGWAIVHVWVTMDSAAPSPRLLRHRLTVEDRTLEGTVAVADEKPMVVGPPLHGGDWIASNGPANSGARHRRALVPIDGRTFIAQRFAIDWARVDARGQVFEGDRADNRSYFGYGAEVLAVANGIVESVKDGIPENVPGGPRLRAADDRETLRAVPMTLETVGGNHVIIDVGQEQHAFYGHLVPGSLRVKPGDRVRRGAVIALLGNSGNSTGPHLHFHIADRNHVLAAEGLPYVIDSWESMRAMDTWERRTNELPMHNAHVRFAGR